MRNMVYGTDGTTASDLRAIDLPFWASAEFEKFVRELSIRVRPAALVSITKADGSSLCFSLARDDPPGRGRLLSSYRKTIFPKGKGGTPEERAAAREARRRPGQRARAVHQRPDGAATPGDTLADAWEAP